MSMVFASLFSLPLPVLLLAAGAHAQSPARQITLVVPYTTASDADLAARNLAEYAPRYLGGQKIVVLNQPGASGARIRAVHQHLAEPLVVDPRLIARKREVIAGREGAGPDDLAAKNRMTPEVDIRDRRRDQARDKDGGCEAHDERRRNTDRHGT